MRNQDHDHSRNSKFKHLKTRGFGWKHINYEIWPQQEYEDTSNRGVALKNIVKEPETQGDSQSKETKDKMVMLA